MTWTAPEVTYGDGDHAAVDYLESALETRWDGEVGVGVKLPGDWTPDGNPFLVVDLTATPGAVHPIEEYQTVRLIAYANTTRDAKRLAAVAQGALLAHPTIKTEYLTGRTTETDESTGAELASCSVRMSMRSQAA